MDLYVDHTATTSRAVLAFCDTAAIPIIVKDIDLMRGEHHQPAFATLNPNRLVPVLVDDEFVLTEAAAILRYLARKSRSPLYPDDLRVRARIDEVMSWFEANLYKDFGYQYVYPQLMPHHARGSDEGTRRTIEWGRDKSRAWLSVLDGHFLAGGKRYLVGDTLSIADFFGASIVSLGELLHCTLDAYPNVRGWYDNVTSHRSWVDVNAAFKGFAASLEDQHFVSLMSTLTLPARPGPRPTTRYAIPHQQLDQTPSPDVYACLVERFLAMPHTTNGPSLISVPGARALFLDCEGPCNEHAFFRGREFAHVHPPEDGSFHMILSKEDCEQVIARGWGELHPLAAAGQIQSTAVMIYAPRNEAEIETVLSVARASRAFAMQPTSREV